MSELNVNLLIKKDTNSSDNIMEINLTFNNNILQRALLKYYKFYLFPL